MNKIKIILATGNQHKIREITDIFEEASFDVTLQSLKDVHVDLSGVKENGSTFEKNAHIKARAVHERLLAKKKRGKAVILADDSGLEIDALNGAPGVRSARYLGEKTPHSEKNRDLLRRLKDVPDKDRTARFVCAVCAVFPDGTECTVRGVFEGRIAHEITGLNGFGYDPIFFVPERSCTSAELAPQEKNNMSHRGKAFREIATIIALKEYT